MTVFIMDSLYFDSVEKSLPAEFAKGSKMLLFYEKGRVLPECVFEYISKGWIILKLLPAKMPDCIPVVTFELGVWHTLHPEDKFILWGDASLTGIFKFFLVYDDSASSYMGIRNILKDQSELIEKPSVSKKNTDKKESVPESTLKTKKERRNPKEKQGRKEKKQAQPTVNVNREAKKTSDMDLFIDMMNALNNEDEIVVQNSSVPHSDKKEKIIKKESEVDVKKASDIRYNTEHPDKESLKNVPSGDSSRESSCRGANNKSPEKKDVKTKERGRENTNVKTSENNRQGKTISKSSSINDHIEASPSSKQLPADPDNKKKSSENNVKKSKDSIAGADLDHVLGEFLQKECFKNFSVSNDEMRCIILSLLVSVDASSIKSGMHLYKEQLEQFLPESRAKVLYDKTAPVFEVIVNYFFLPS